MGTVIDQNQVQQALDTLRPALIIDGGDMELVRIEGAVVYIRLKGACIGCPFSLMHIKMGIETQLKLLVPAISELTVVD